MNYKSLIRGAEVRGYSAQELLLPSLPKDGKNFLKELAQRFPGENAAVFGRDRFKEDLEVTSYPSATSSWYDDRKIRCLLWPGDLTIEGDLLDNDFNLLPLLIVKGNLSLRNWLRGGMPAFVGGSVRAKGFIIGHYNDSALFVGGDLTAAGYIPRAKPYKDYPKVVPHQIAGKIDARKFDNTEATKESLQAAFVDEALTEEDGETYLDEKAVFERSNAGLPVWR